MPKKKIVPVVHDVRKDWAAGGYARLTCYTCGATLLRKPFMNEGRWESELETFLKKHPAPTTLNVSNFR
jgi:hypothetical protein